MAKLTLDKLRKGAVYLVDGPTRIVKVTEITTRSVPQKDTSVPSQQPVVKVMATIPTKTIRGFVTNRQAKQRRAIFKAIPAGKFWEETWGEKVVDGLIMKSGVLVETDDPKLRVVKLWCFAEFGRMSKHTRTSAVINREVVPRLIPPGVLPGGMFDGEVVDPNVDDDYEEEAPEEEAA